CQARGTSYSKPSKSKPGRRGVTVTPSLPVAVRSDMRSLFRPSPNLTALRDDQRQSSRRAVERQLVETRGERPNAGDDRGTAGRHGPERLREGVGQWDLVYRAAISVSQRSLRGI